MRPTRPVEAEIDLDAITHNIGLIRAMAGPGRSVIVPVKANAYGHGMVPVCRHLETLGVEGLATANVDDAIAARSAGVGLPILLYGASLPDGLEEVVAHGLTPTVMNPADVEALARVARSRPSPIDVHIKVDAGMGRLGVRLDRAVDFATTVVDTPGLRLEGVYTHIPFSDADGARWSAGRLAAFAATVAEVQDRTGVTIRFAQAAASSVMSQGFPDPLNTVSPGHLTFGLHPMTGARAEHDGFRKALRSLRAQIIHIGDRPDGTTTGVILLGMDNGYRRGPTATEAHMLCKGVRCPVMGVSAEYTVIDVSAVPSPAVGDTVTVIGTDGESELAAEDVALHLGAPSAAYWLTGLKSVPFRHVGGIAV